MAASAATGRALEEAAESETVEFFVKFLEENYGTVLKAWRFELDPSGDGELLYPEFLEALAAMPKLQCDITVLWTALMRRAAGQDNDAVLRLRELSEDEYTRIDHFKRWADQKFGGAIAMMKTVTEDRPNASMGFDAFEDACKRFGYDGDAEKIFYGLLCQRGSETVSLRDIAYLESDAVKRKGAMDPSFVMMQNAARAAAKRIKERKRRLQGLQEVAMQEFLQKLRKVSGSSVIRGWRRILDQNGNLAISKTELLRGCKKIAFDGDVVALWKSMDVDDDGIVMLEEVDVKLALVLASFKKWSIELNGCCVAMVIQMAAMTKRKSPKWTAEDFAQALRLAEFNGPSEVTPQATSLMLYEAFDVHNQGFFTSQDVAFLDKWNPTPWLMADPSEEGKEAFLAALRTRYPSMLVAWRKVLDRENSNRVAYKEFLNACRTLRLHNAPATWRALDDDASGFISINEIDEEAANTLLGFKEWAETTFGTIQRMYHVIDKSRTNKVSFQVFRRALRNFGFQGDAAVLFESLKPDNGKKGNKNNTQKDLSLDDLLYLSTWECAPGSDNRNNSDDEVAETPQSGSPRHSCAPSGGTSPKAQQAPPQRRRRKSSCAAKGRVSSASAMKRANSMKKSASDSKIMDAMSYCRNAKEYEAFEKAGEKSYDVGEKSRAGNLLNLYLPQVTAKDMPGKVSLRNKLARNALPLAPRLPTAQEKVAEHLENLGVLPLGDEGVAHHLCAAGVSLPAL